MPYRHLAVSSSYETDLRWLITGGTQLALELHLTLHRSIRALEKKALKKRFFSDLFEVH